MDRQRCEEINGAGVRYCSRVLLLFLARVVVVRLEDSLQCAADQARHAIYRGRTNQQIPDRSSQGDDRRAEFDDDLVVVRDGEVCGHKGSVHEQGEAAWLMGCMDRYKKGR